MQAYHHLKSNSISSSASYNKPAISTDPWKMKLESSQSRVMANLLYRAGIISEEQYYEAADIAASINKSIDHVIMASFLSGFQSELCTNAMSYIERGIVTEDLAASALAKANLKGLSFGEGLKYFGFGW